jgi:tetratricopeptide (TPR) repeat protein/predicted Ser/Thr protein kinase
MLSARCPVAIGRFRVLDVVGEGGMSVVFVAHDPELDRRVAIKLVRRELSKSREAVGRLQMEAQAIARVEHPNVIRVYDAGESPEGVWIAMELVAGETLKDWVRGAPRAQPRPWREVLARFLDAAAGLQAAHEAGIVHRDFKPANVLLRQDGRAVVADFGLALTREAWVRLASGSPAGVAGTFHYLAPELFAGGVPGEASDQYSFCVSLYEALNLEVPFHAASPAALVEEIAQGPPPSRAGVPKWLHAVLARGLAVRPEDRWPSMAALVAALRDDPAVGRRRRLRITGLAAGFAAVAGLGFVAHSTSVRCRGLERDLQPVWSDAVRARVAAAFGSSRAGYAQELWRRIAPRLDDYAARLVAGRVNACRAAVAGTHSPRLLDLRMACYAERRDELARVVGGLTAGEASLRDAPRSLEALGSLDDCANTRALFYTAGRQPEQMRLAESKRQAGRELLAKRQFDAGETALRESLQAAFASRDDRQVAAAALDLAEGSVKRTSAPPREAEQWLLVARGAASSAPARPELQARLAALAGEVALRNGALDEAAKQYAAAVDFARTPVARLDYKMGLRRVLEQTPGAQQRGLALARETLALGEEAFGPHHPDTVLLRVGLAIELWHSAQRAESERLAVQARDDARRIALPEAEGAAENLLGNLHQDRGDLAEAQTHFEKALDAYTRAYGRRSTMTAEVLNNLAELALRRNQLEEAEILHREVLAINRVVLGPKHTFVAEDLSSLGHVLALRGETREAATMLVEALRLTEELHGETSAEAGIAQLDLALTLPTPLLRSRAAEAGWRIVAQATEVTSPDRGLAMSLYGEALAGAGRRAEGLHWMRAALADLERVAGPDDDLTAEAARRLARWERPPSALTYVAAVSKGTQ